MKIFPRNDCVAVKRIEPEAMTATGLYIPEAAKEKPSEATVVAAGPGRMLENGQRAEIHLFVGERILFGKYSGVTVEVDGEELVILRADDILARLSD